MFPWIYNEISTVIKIIRNNLSCWSILHLVKAYLHCNFSASAFCRLFLQFIQLSGKMSHSGPGTLKCDSLMSLKKKSHEWNPRLLQQLCRSFLSAHISNFKTHDIYTWLSITFKQVSITFTHQHKLNVCIS